ncbi:MAG: bifunctional diaminohydroxyphosphoribosylaminopyrimidine deaminase/5-amino-6-(5-phosphoribosylamino)uracil reductase RibD [Gammaproteobacteria bacterium]|nr:bifunctional diaminohydroxyphosphoribosylaminopyrimidine deaminase/5-amino-6-(5-phosphoribosylamino)uracil reductase RibD [Gammaproteobacteria bacterium]
MNSVAANNDVEMMQQVLDLAEQGATTTQPNPRVGCVIVNDGEIVGRGYHHMAGDLHAERVALQEAGDRARGATVYLNLEPCCHQGRTPPCTDGLIDAGVAKVVAAMSDPNPAVSGGGYTILQDAGIEVSNGVMEAQARWLNRGFISRMSRRRPWVVLKTAATLDGRTAAFDGQSKWITGEQARAEVQQLRAACSAVITGIGTVLADDPEMNVRLPGVLRQPLRVLLDTDLKLPLEARIIGSDQNLVVFTRSQDLPKIAALTELGVEVIQQAEGATPLDLEAVLVELGHWECNEVLIEAGQTLAGAFLQQSLIDELQLFYAGSLLGDAGKSMFHFDRPLAFDERAQYRVREAQMVGEDIRVGAVNEASLAQIQGQSSATEGEK